MKTKLKEIGDLEHWRIDYSGPSPEVIKYNKKREITGRIPAQGSQTTIYLTTNGLSTGDLLTDNPLLSPNVNIQCTAIENTNSAIEAPYPSVVGITGDGKGIVVNMVEGNSGSIGALGGSYTGTKFNNEVNSALIDFKITEYIS